MRLKGGMGAREAEEELKGSLASDKNEILWGRFGVNYNDEKEMFRKGSVVFREVGGVAAAAAVVAVDVRFCVAADWVNLV